jgi:hypothetical protein
MNCLCFYAAGAASLSVSFGVIDSEWNPTCRTYTSGGPDAICDFPIRKALATAGVESFSRAMTVVPNELTFNSLIESWHKERGASSSTHEITTTDSYQRIIGMGKDALPLILDKLRAEGDKPDHWFAALRAITGLNPVPAEIRGNMKEMAKAWLGWVYENHV